MGDGRDDHRLSIFLTHPIAVVAFFGVRRILNDESVCCSPGGRCGVGGGREAQPVSVPVCVRERKGCVCVC